MTMADKIVVMHDGVVEQMGAPLDLYDRPANQFVAGFHRIAGDELHQGQGRREQLPLRRNGERHPAAARGAPAGADGKPVVYGVRPEHLELADDGVLAEVVVVEPTGSETQIVARVGEQDIIAVFRERQTVRPGENIRLKPRHQRRAPVRQGDRQAPVRASIARRPESTVRPKPALSTSRHPQKMSVTKDVHKIKNQRSDVKQPAQSTSRRKGGEDE